jgi:hypothetical protein
MAETLQVSHSTVLKYLHDDFQSFHLRWVPHLLTPELRGQRHAYAIEMIPILAAAAHERWHHFVTGDESWLFVLFSASDVDPQSR